MNSISIGDIIAVMALALSAYAIWTTRQFNKRQLNLIEMQEELSARQLEQGKQDALDASRADVSARYIKEGRSRYKLKIYNKGKAQARNVRIEFPNSDSPVPSNDLQKKLPMEALAQHEWVDLIAAVHMGTPPKIESILRWEDDHALENKKTVYLTL